MNCYLYNNEFTSFFYKNYNAFYILEVLYMTKKDFLRIISSKTGVTQKDLKIVVEAMSDTIRDIMDRNDSIKFGDLCTFYGVKREPRLARNPKTGETVQLEERDGYPKCSFSKKTMDLSDITRYF